LAYKRGKPAIAQDAEIWLLDRELYRHFIFSFNFFFNYVLLLMYLGLPQWQYDFTSYGIPQVKQWFNIYKPITYNTNQLIEETNSFMNKLDRSKVFKSKNKTLIPQKKEPNQPAGGQKGPSVPSFTSKFSCSPGNPVGNEHPHFPASPTAMISMHRRPKPLPI
uniref:Uncharacterized protein n=1 Tax=Felis catus TaxID=9685 RepID=A0ABI7WNN9_FELCA